MGLDLDGDPTRGYVLAWVDANSGARRVMLRRILPDGTPVATEPITLHEVDDPSLRSARVAYGSTSFLVTWAGADSQGRPAVFGKRVSLGGAVLDPLPLNLLPGSTPDVDYEAGVFLVVSTHEPTNHFRYVHAARLASDGTALDTVPIIISSSYARFPRVASTAGSFLVTWSGYGSHDSSSASTLATPVDPSGSHGPTFAVENAPGSTYGPRVAAGPQGFLITFSSDSDVLARKFFADGTPAGSAAGIRLTYADGYQAGASAVAFAGGWLCAWNDYRAHPPLEAGLGDVYGARLSASDSLLDPEGISIQTGDTIQGNPELAGSGGDGLLALVAWSESHQAFRIHVATFHTDAIGTRICSPAVPNSTGTFASLLATGSDIAFDNDVTLHLDGAPPATFGIFVTSEALGFTQHPGGSQGNLCLGGTIGRFNAHIFQTTTAGTTTFSPDLSRIPIGPGIPAFPGETWAFQAWFRDTNPTPTSNFTDTIAIDLR